MLVASGEPDPSDDRWLRGADLVVAVDAGAEWLDERGIRPDALVGDLDSVAPELVSRLEADGVAIERHPTAKDSSDTELAVAYGRRRGATEIDVIGAFGGQRLDHLLANLLLLSGPAGDGLALVRAGSRITSLRGGEARTVDGDVGGVVSLFPVGGDAIGVTTTGLQFPLRDETLRTGSSRGLSNVIVAKPASASIGRGALLVYEGPAGEPPAKGDGTR
ncbi:MAG TPA: thiamine diphosphokinase [Candidatus Limnocylindria bacterium]